MRNGGEVTTSGNATLLQNCYITLQGKLNALEAQVNLNRQLFIGIGKFTIEEVPRM